MSDVDDPASGANPFLNAWTDLLSHMGVGGSGAAAPAGPAPASWSDEAMGQMQRAFLDAMAKHCDEYLRSPAYLNLMKQTMDNAMTFKQQVDRFLAEAHRAAHSPSTEDVDDVAATLRRIEDRLIGRLDALEGRIRGLEDDASTPGPGKKTATSKKTNKA